MRRWVMPGIALLTALLASAAWGQENADSRSSAHQDYGKKLWDYLHRDGRDYTTWSECDAVSFPFGPPVSEQVAAYRRTPAAGDELPYGSLIVHEHRDKTGKVNGLTAYYRVAPDFDRRHDDWYWVHYLPDGTLVKCSADKDPHPKRGFVTFDDEGRLWVFRWSEPELGNYLRQGELAKQVIRPAAGPDRKTLKSTDNATLLEYVAAKPGFVVLPEGERIWVFRPDSPELEQLQQQGELARHVIRPGAGPLGATLKGPDTKTINDYLTSAPGFVTRFDNGRLWVFREGSDELKQFEADGELAKHVIRVAAGPAGLTVKAPDAETIQDYLEAVGQ